MADLAVVVTYNSDRTLAPVLAAIEAWTATAPGNHAVLIDNGSTDGTLDLTARVLGGAPRVLVRSSGSNVGFSHGVNSALRSAEEAFGVSFDATVLINPDMSFTAHLLTSLLATFHGDRHLGVVAPLLVDSDGAQDRGAARRDWNLRTLYWEVAGWPPGARLVGSRCRSIAMAAGSGIRAADIVSGAFMVIRRDVLGPGLDASLPMYLEDQEICIRSRRLGFGVAVSTDQVAIHYGGASSETLTSGRRYVRMLELAEAPVAALRLGRRRPPWLCRAVVAVASLQRLVTVVAVALVAGLSPGRRPWLRRQATLGRWLLSWAVFGLPRGASPFGAPPVPAG